MSLLTAEEVTNLYLYGNKTKPASIENENLIRKNPLGTLVTTSVDINEYMTTGPGRFASPAFFEVVKQFFSSTSSSLVPGTYTKQDLYTIFGLNTYEDKTVNIQQSLYDDGQDNYLERAYIWESTAFKIDDRTTFVVEADGNHYIKNFGVVPFSDPGKNPIEDFDFKSGSGFSKIVNFALEPIVDPSGIGRTVVISFDGTRNLQDMFTYQDYTHAASTAVLPNPGLVETIIANAFSFTQQLFDNGSTRFLDADNKPILYGSDQNDLIFGTQSRTNVDIADVTHPLRGWVENGIRYIGGAGDDKLVGTDYADKLFGGSDNDFLDGLSGDDYLEGGQGNDRLLGEDGNDSLHGDDGAGGDILEGGSGFDTYYADDGDIILDSDGQGTIYLNGKQLSFATRKAGETTWTDAAGNTFTLNGTTLQINDPLTVEGFSNGQLGIYLDEAEDPANPPQKPPYNPNNSRFVSSSPLALDLNNNGRIDDIGLDDSTVYFDLTQDGIAEKTGWLAPEDGLLTMDMNGNGVVDDRAELFGTDPLHTAFDRLAELVDVNQDGVVNADDPLFAALRVWQDANRDGISQAAELKDLATLGITSISTVQTAVVQTTANGNSIIATGSYTRNGEQHYAADIEFVYDAAFTDANPNRPLDQPPALDAEVFQLPWLRGYGEVKSLHIAYQEEGSLRQAATELITQGRDGILQNFEGFMAQWTGLEAAHQAKGVSRTNLTLEDKVWMLETITGQNVQKAAIAAAGFAHINPTGGGWWNSAYIEGQWQALVQQEAIGFAIQASAKDWIKGAYYSLAGDRFVAIDAAQLQNSLVQGLSAIDNQQDAVFAAVTLDRLRSDGIDLQAATLKPALAALPYAQAYQAAIDGRFGFQMQAGTFSVPDAQDWWVTGNGGSDVLNGNGGNDMLDGGVGNDALAGGGGSDTLAGGAGNDYLVGGGGNDALIGGADNDTLDGGAGNDTYQFGRGDGHDSVSSNDTATGKTDQLLFTADVASTDINLSRTHDDLTLTIRDTGDSITLENYFMAETANPYGVEQIKFADGVAWDFDVIKNRLPVIATVDNDTIYGYDAFETIAAGLGNDTLYARGGDDTVSGGAGNDRLFGEAGNDMLDGGAGSDYLQGGTGNDTLDAGTGNDSLQGDTGNDTYVFGRGYGQDAVYDYDGSAGNFDKVQIASGVLPADVKVTRDQSQLYLSINNPDGIIDKLTLQNWFSQNAYKVEQVVFADDPTTVWDVAALNALANSATEGADYIEGTDGDNVINGLGGNDQINGQGGNDILLGGDGDDVLIGGLGNDILDGGAGKDTLQGNTGNDTYVFGLGSGQDTIYDNDTTAGNVDTIRLGTGIAASDIEFGRNGSDLVISINGTIDQLKIQYWGYGDAYRIEQVEFTDGTVWGATDLPAQLSALPIMGTNGNDNLSGDTGNNTLDGGAGNDTLQGGTGNDTYLFNLGGGQDTIYDYDATAGNVDTVRFGVGIAASDIAFSHIGNDLVLSINGAADQLKIQNWGYGINYRIERVEFTDGTVWEATDLPAQLSVLPIMGTNGNDNLSGDAGNNTLDGGVGNDTLYGGAGNDTYLFNLGGGQDTIYDYDVTAGNVDTVRFGVGIAAGGITFSRIGNDLVLGINGTADQVKIQDWGYGINYRIERVEFADGTSWDAANLQAQALSAFIVGTTGNDTLYGESGNNMLDGGAGNDTLQGGAGNDTYLFNLGGGQDTISDYDATAGNVDTVRFGAGIAASDITFSRSGKDLVLGINGTIDQVKIQNWDNGDAYHIERVEFADGTSWDAAYLQAQVSALPIIGTTGNDSLSGDLLNNTLEGKAGNDTLQGGAGNDTLDGGIGNDYLEGGAGNDTYLYNLGDGQDCIYDGAGNADTIRFGTGITAGDIIFGHYVSDLVLGIKGMIDQVRVSSWENGSWYRIERVEFADGTSWDAAYLQAQALAATFLVGTSFNDSLYGDSRDNMLYGGTGNDTLQGGEGSDTYLFNLGDGQDTIYDVYYTGSNVDAIRFGVGIASADITFLRSGNDLVLGIKGTADQLKIQSWGASGQYQIERMEFSDGTTWDVFQLRAAMSLPPILGTEQSDTLNAWAGENAMLQGLGGNDTLYGNSGNDILDGGVGADSMLGSYGNDTYIIDNLGDTVTETVNYGTDTVISSIDYTLGANLENLILTGTMAINGTGNSFNNILTGNDAANTLAGGDGDDTYVIGAGDIVVEASNKGIDTVLSSIAYTLAKNAENLVLTGTMAINGTGNSLNNILTGNDAVNTLDGGAGDDTYVIGTGDIVVEASNRGIDTVLSGIAYTLAANVENLTLTGADGLKGTGNSLNNILTGNSAANILDGGSGADTLIGGLGNDTYTVDNIGDVVTETSLLSTETDTVLSTITYTLGSNVENLTLAGTSAINGTGNNLNNILIGNTGNNALNGDTGSDLLNGDLGSDTLVGDIGNDILQGGAGNDTLSDTSGINLLDGGSGSDTLTGNDSNEMFVGGSGNDIITNGNGADIIAFNRGDGQDVVNGGVGTDNTLSLGGGIPYSDLAFSKVGNDLIVEVGNSDQLKLSGWYDITANHKSVLNLQIFADAMAGFDRASSDPLLNKSIQNFDFITIVNAFDQARGGANLMHWNAGGSLLAAHLSASDNEALGGDLANQYGKNGSFSGLSLTAAQDVLDSPSFGFNLQVLHDSSALNGGMVWLV